MRGNLFGPAIFLFFIFTLDYWDPEPKSRLEYIKLGQYIALNTYQSYKKNTTCFHMGLENIQMMSQPLKSHKIFGFFAFS
jgi:hypothetical protein